MSMLILSYSSFLLVFANVLMLVWLSLWSMSLTLTTLLLLLLAFVLSLSPIPLLLYVLLFLYVVFVLSVLLVSELIRLTLSNMVSMPLSTVHSMVA